MYYFPKSDDGLFFFFQQPKLDWIPMIEHMIEYKGMLSTFPDIIHVQKVSW